MPCFGPYRRGFGGWCGCNCGCCPPDNCVLRYYVTCCCEGGGGGNTCCCPDDPIPDIIFITFSNGTNNYAPLNDNTYPMTLDNEQWNTEDGLTPIVNNVFLFCNEFVGNCFWAVTLNSNTEGCSANENPTNVSCNPFLITGTLVSPGGICGSVDYVITF